MREPGCVMIWMVKVANAWSMPSQLENMEVDWESRVSTRMRRIFRAALAAMDWPFRTTEPQGLPFAIMSATVVIASLLMRRVLRERTRRLEHCISIMYRSRITVMETAGPLTRCCNAGRCMMRMGKSWGPSPRPMLVFANLVSAAITCASRLLRWD